jgi:hypothetical protein
MQMKPYAQFEIPKNRYEFFKLIRKSDGTRVKLKPLCTAKEYQYLIRESKKYYCHSYGYCLEWYRIQEGENKYYAPFHKMLLYFKLKFGEDYIIIKKKDYDEEKGEFWFPEHPLTFGLFDDNYCFSNSSTMYLYIELDWFLPTFIAKPLQKWAELGWLKYDFTNPHKIPNEEQKRRISNLDFVKYFNEEGLQLAKQMQAYFWNKIEIKYAPVSEYWFAEEEEKDWIKFK